MRYYVEACFNTDASGLVLSSSPAEDNAVLIADRCCVELRLRTSDANPSSHHGVNIPMLEVLPWNSSQLRLCVNGVSYGTGPLLLRTGDVLTLQSKTSTSADAPQEYSYCVTALPDASASSPLSPSSLADGMDNREQGLHETSLSAEEQRPHTIAANVAEYAKWNSFYSDRFGNCTPTSVASAGSRGLIPLHRCTCGRYLLDVGGGSCSCRAEADLLASLTCTVEAGGDPLSSSSLRTFLTLLPSVPTLLQMEDAAAKGGGGGTAASPAVVSCCACPFFLPRTDRGGFKVRARCGEADTVASSTFKGTATAVAAETPEDSQGASSKKSPAAQAPSQGASAWAAYVRAREKDWPSAVSTSVSKEKDCSDMSPKAALDRPSAELLLRIAALESALMGCRYE
jgi:hypothetical protein